VGRALLAGGATWTAASAGFAESPSRSQLIMAGFAALLTAGAVIFEPDTPPPSTKKIIRQVTVT